MKITKAQLKQIIKEELGQVGQSRAYEELVLDLGDLLRRALDEEPYMQPDEVRSAVEEALGVHLGSDEGKIMAHAGLASDRYEREERAIRRAGPKGRIPFDPSLYGDEPV